MLNTERWNSENPVPVERYAETLNALRFLAACIIITAHFGYKPLEQAGLPAVFLNLIDGRSLFTSLFFLLSGFLLAVRNAGRTVAFLPFIRRRIARIYPAHLFGFWATLILIGPEIMKRESFWQSVRDVLAWLTITQGLVPSTAVYNVPAWALTSFVLGYLLLPSTLKLRTCSPAALFLLGLSLWLVAIQPALALAATAPADFSCTLRHPVAPSPGLASTLNSVHMYPVTRLLEFVIGALLGLGASQRRVEEPRALRWISSDFFLLGLFAAVQAVLATVISHGRLHFLVGHGLLLPVLVLLTLGLWYNQGFLKRILSASFLQRGGRSVLLLYFLHYPWFIVVFGLLGARWETFCLGLVLLFLACARLQEPYDQLSLRLNRLPLPA